MVSLQPLPLRSSSIARRLRHGVVVAPAVLFLPVAAVLVVAIVAHALPRLVETGFPVVLGLQYGRLQQDHELAFEPAAVRVLERVAENGDAAQARYLPSGARIRLLHESADRHDIAVAYTHDSVRLTDAARGERQPEYAGLAEVDI